jgi:hypothetical protein
VQRARCGNWGVARFVRTCQISVMRTVGRNFFNSMRAAIAALLVFAFLLPTLVQALPSPELSPEQALLRDIATSVCSEVSGKSDGKRQHDDQNCQHCILCSAPSISLARLDAAPASDLSADAHSGARAGPSWSAPRLHPLSRETGPPRGPPRLS